RQRTKTDARAPPEEEPAALPRAPLPDPEALAGAGRYAEAIHAVWLRTLAELAARQRLSLPPSQTTREIAAAGPASAQARPALRALVGAVEESLFGGRPVGPDEYRSSLDNAKRVLA